MLHRRFSTARGGRAGTAAAGSKARATPAPFTAHRNIAAAAARTEGGDAAAPSVSSACHSDREGRRGQGTCDESAARHVTLGAAAQQSAAATALSALLLLSPMAQPGPAHAVLQSPNAQIARSVDAALRRSIPAFNPVAAKLQKTLEEIQYLLRIPQRKPWGSMSANVVVALDLASTDPARRAALLEGTPGGAEGEQQAGQLIDQLLQRLRQLDLAVRTQQPDVAGLRVAQSLQVVSELELLQAPGLPYVLPRDYVQQGLPILTGRATVELKVEKADGSTAFTDSVNGGINRTGTVRIVLDGYSAPLSAGNFAANVQDGLYDNTKVQSNYSSVYVLPGPSANGRTRAPIPLEVLPVGEFDPVYRVPLDVRSGELPVLPLSITGAVTMAHVPGSDSYLSGDEWFVFKFDKQQAGLSGLAFDEGTFGVFGYVTEGMDEVMSKLQSGDVIVSARIVAGADKLQRPGLAAAAPAVVDG